MSEELLSLEAAQEAVLRRVRVLDAEEVRTGEAHGRVLSEPARAVVDLPPFPSSAMDGFAVRAVDAPGTLPVVFRIAAGRPASRALGSGEAMGIATGGVVPEGADAVVPIEAVVTTGEAVQIPAVVPGARIRPTGGDVRAGEVVVPAGVRLTPARIGALAAAGVAQVLCVRRPHVAVLTTGTELQQPGRPLGPGQVYEANGLVLAAQLAAAGALVEQLPAVEDEPELHRAALERGLDADVLVTSGGVSVGPHDLVRKIEAELGIEEVFWRVAVKPGKPVSFGARGGTLVFGLPGNPVSTLVTCELFVLPAVRALQGLADPLPRYELGRAGAVLSRNAGRDEFLRARVSAREGEIVLDPVSGQDSHMIVRAAEADALLFVPRGEGVIAAGDAVRYLRLG